MWPCLSFAFSLFFSTLNSKCGGEFSGTLGTIMRNIRRLLNQIARNIATILTESERGQELYKLLLTQHPADIAAVLERIEEKERIVLFKKLPLDMGVMVFEELPSMFQASILINVTIDAATSLLRQIRIDKVIDLFDHLTDPQLKKYLELMQQKQRNLIISLLNFEPESAGRIMNSEILSIPSDLTIKQTITLLQRVQPRREQLGMRLYVTNKVHKLVGYINMDDLVCNKPEIAINQIMHNNELIVDAHEDQEIVANQIRHYDITSAPVVDKDNYFLGAIMAHEVFDIFAEEASEDVYKISGVPGAEEGYFQTPFWKLVWLRSPWLIALLLLQGVSSSIMANYDTLLRSHTIVAFFLTMLIGTAGNAGNQSGALVIRGLAVGEMTRKNGYLVMIREFRVSLIMAFVLSVIGFGRVYLTHFDIASALAINISLFFIIITSMMLGTFLPLMLDRLNFDPAHSAAPFLATLTDIIGIVIYFTIASKMLG